MPGKKAVRKVRKDTRLGSAVDPDKLYTIEDGVTQSLLSSWVNCRKSADLYLAGWRSPETKASLAFGGLWHYLLEELYKAIRAGKVTSATYETIRPLLYRRIVRWKKKIQTWTSPIEAQTVELIIAKAMALLPAYCEMWAADFTPELWLDLETVFDVDFYGTRLRGRIDGIRRVTPKARNRARKSPVPTLWLLETKTMANVSSALEDALTFDFQCLFYILAAKLMLKQDIAGVVYNVVRNPSSKPKQGESLSQYTARLLKDIDKRPDHYFKRFELVFPAAVQQEFKRELADKITAFTAWVAARHDYISIMESTASAITGYTFKNERACRGRWTCDWLQACSSGSMAGYVSGGRLFEELED